MNYYGGAVLSNKANVTFTDCAISGNNISNSNNVFFGYANCFGGGLYNYQGTMSLTRCTISNNGVYVWGGGGGLCNEGGTLTLANCTLSGNLIYVNVGWFAGLVGHASRGGGIWNSGTLNLSGCTLANNSAIARYGTFSGGDYGPPDPPPSDTSGLGNSLYNAGTSSSTQINLYQTILANSSPAGGQNVVNDTGIVLTSLGYNLSNDASGPNNGATDHLNVDAKLIPLADYGGPTPTHVPLPGSPALDAGDPTSTATRLRISAACPGCSMDG